MVRLLFFLLLSYSTLSAQVTDTLVNDPSIILNDTTSVELSEDTITTKRSFIYRTFKEDYPSPKKAALLAIVPGMGQVYNKKWWKLPIVYGAFTGLYFSIKFNRDNYNTFQTAYLAEVNGETHEFVGTQLDNANTLKTLRDGYDKNLQLSYIGGVLVYLLQGVDAFVDAHLLSFDVDEDLSINVDPSIISIGNQNTLGMGIVLEF